VTWLFPALAVLAIGAVLGTDRLGRPFTDEEGEKRFGALLREHDCSAHQTICCDGAPSPTCMC
jgi:hypothetical protein